MKKLVAVENKKNKIYHEMRMLYLFMNSALLMGDLWPLRRKRPVSLTKSHRTRSVSFEPLHMRTPLASNPMVVTADLWPLNVR